MVSSKGTQLLSWLFYHKNWMDPLTDSWAMCYRISACSSCLHEQIVIAPRGVDSAAVRA